MLTATFLHASGVGPATERRIWEQSILHWEDFLSGHERVKLSPVQHATLLDTIPKSLESLQAHDHRFFADVVPPKEHWRAYDVFGHRAAFVDIETTGMGTDDPITVIGLYNGREMKHFVRDHNMQDFADEVRQYSMLVTFFGTVFDLPRIKGRFPSLRLDQLHVDLCFSMRRLGMKGGLKCVEEMLGLERSQETKGLSGWDAVRLWYEYQRGSEEALQLLLRYNEEDVVHLKALMDYTYDALRKRCIESVGCWNADRPGG